MKRQQHSSSVAAGLVLAVLITAGCTNPNTMQDTTTDKPPAPSTPARCPTDGADIDPGLGVAPRTPPVLTGSVPTGFPPVTALVCRAVDLQNRGGSGLIRYTVTTQEAPSSVQLGVALQLPDQQFVDVDRGTCSLEFTPLPYLLLLDSKRQAIRPAIPVDACGRSRDQVDRAIADLGLQETGRVTVDDVYRGR